MIIKVVIVTLKLARMKMMRQVRKVLLQSIIVVKLFIYKVRQVLQKTTGITKYDRYYKVRRLLQIETVFLSQNETIVFTKCDNFVIN